MELWPLQPTLFACLIFDPILLHSWLERALTPSMFSLQLRHYLMALEIIY